jgi:hypothetical protein
MQGIRSVITLEECNGSLLLLPRVSGGKQADVNWRHADAQLRPCLLA